MSEVSPQGEFLRLAREGGRGALATVIGPEDTPALGRKLLVTPDGLATGGLGDEDVDAGAAEAAAELLWAERSETRELGGLQVFIDVVAPALDVTRSMSALARRLARSAGSELRSGRSASTSATLNALPSTLATLRKSCSSAPSRSKRACTSPWIVPGRTFASRFPSSVAILQRPSSMTRRPLSRRVSESSSA